MRAVRIRDHGGPEVLELVTLPDPEPGPGEMLVRNAAVGVNFVDLQHRAGHPYPVALPLVPGTEAAGTVVAVGDHVDPAWVGRDVVHLGHLAGAYAELTAVDKRFVAELPAGASAEDAAAIAMAGTTAHVLTHRAVALSGATTVVVHGAAGSTGGAVVQLAAAAGAHVVALASSPARAEVARALGAHVALAVTDDHDDVVRTVRDATGGGAHLVYDATGGPTFLASLRMLRAHGRLVLYGQTAGPVVPFDPALLSGFTGAGVAGSLTLQWVAASHYLTTEADRREAMSAVHAAVAAGRLSTRVAARLPLDHAAQAHRLLGDRAVAGKVLLIC